MKPLKGQISIFEYMKTFNRGGLNMSENEQKDDILTLANGKTVQDIAEYDDGIDGEPEIIILVERED